MNSPNRESLLRALMRTHDCTHLLVSDSIDVRYASGFSSSNASILLAPDKCLLCTDFRYQEALKRFCRRSPQWTPVIVTESGFGMLRQHVPAGARLGIQSSVLTLDEHTRLRKAIPRVKLIRLGTGVSSLFEVKIDRELRWISRAGRISCTALRQTIPQIRVGMSECELRDRLEEQCRTLGSERPAFDTIVLFGRRSALPHGLPSRTRLRTGDFILIDFGCVVEGLCSDMTRTFVMGQASPRQRAIYETVRQAQQQARGRVHAGVDTATIDAIARDTITAAGYGERFGHATGHGLGYRIHEPPRLSATSSTRLHPHAVVTVEPGIYIPSLGGVRIEDTLCVTARGGRILTPFTRKLTELDVQ